MDWPFVARNLVAARRSHASRTFRISRFLIIVNLTEQHASHIPFSCSLWLLCVYDYRAAPTSFGHILPSHVIMGKEVSFE
jgi:hypothetical protein